LFIDVIQQLLFNIISQLIVCNFHTGKLFINQFANQ